MNDDYSAPRRMPPNDQVAEQSTLGGMMLSKKGLFDAFEKVRGEDFYVPKHGVIFDAIMSLASHGEPCDVVAVTDELIKTGELQRAGGADYLHTLTSIVPSAGSAGYYAKIVADRAVMRRVAEAGERIAELGYGNKGEPADVVEVARAEVDSLIHPDAHGGAASVADTFDYWVEDMESQEPAVETPWHELDSLIHGFRRGRLYVVGARPGDGKSLVALQCAARLARTGPVAFASLEMSRNEIITRLVAMRARIHATALQTHQLNSEQWTRIATARKDITDLDLVIDDRSGVNITQVQSFARTTSRRGSLAGVVVDYLQLIEGQQGKDRHVAVAEISRRLKIMARDLNCPVIALSQLNRGSEIGGAKTRRAPSLADLRESGAIEQDADVVILLQRPLEKDGEPGDRLNMHVAKNRHGQTGMRTLLWEAKFSRITSPAWAVPLDFPAEG